LITQWPKLVRYVEDPRLAIDTNLAENAIRPFALGRRNWLFADTVKGARASAALYSIVSTARANGLEPYAYLRRLFAELPKAKNGRRLRGDATLQHYVDFWQGRPYLIAYAALTRAGSHYRELGRVGILELARGGIEPPTRGFSVQGPKRTKSPK